MSQQTLTQTTCYHCGDVCPPQPIKHAEKDFCCEGCKMVYQILAENDLCQYYDLEANPGLQVKTGRKQTRFAFLDHPDIQQQLIQFSEGGISQVTFHLPQIHCSSCVWLLENLYRLHPGITHARVHFLRKEVQIRFEEGTLSLREVVSLLASIGYEPNLSLQQMEGIPKRRVNRSFAMKLGVAGFAFGNIMLFSFPEYLGLDKAIDPQFFALFGWLNLVLALPVLLYSGSVFLKPAWQGLRQGLLTIDVPISLGMLALFGRSVVEIITHSGAGYLDSLAGLVFFLLIGKWFQRKSYDTLSFDRDYTSYFPLATTKLEDDQEVSIPVTAAKPGDELLIRDQELIPADAVLLSDQAGIDYSFVTGEAEPIIKRKGELIYAGGRQCGAAIRVAVAKPVSQSYLTSLWNQEEEDPQAEILSGLADRLSKRFTLFILVIASLAALYWGIRVNGVMAVNIFTAVLIVACPCGLALTSPIVLGSAMRWFGRKGVYVKHTGVIERMAYLDHLVFDKTGTLTPKDGIRQLIAPEVPFEDQIALTNLARQSQHPVSQQIASHFSQTPQQAVTAYQAQPGAGIAGKVMDQSVLIGSQAYLRDMTGATPPTAGTWAQVADQVYGPFTLISSYRPGLQGLFSDLGKAYQLSLLSGDTAREEPFLRQIMPTHMPMHFQQHPQDKQAYIQSLQADGAQVMMIGDGLNDAGALKVSDVGMAVAESAETFSPACDVILEGKQLPYLAQYLQWSRQTYQIVKGGLVLSLIYNLLGLTIAVMGYLSPLVAAILMPVSSVSVVLYGMGATWLSQRMQSIPYDKNQFV